MAMKKLTRIILESAASVAHKVEATAIFVHADLVPDPEVLKKVVGESRIILVCRGDNTLEKGECAELGLGTIQVPPIALSRIGQIKMAVMISISQGLLKAGDTIVCIAGIPKTGVADTLMVLEIGEEFEILNSVESVTMAKAVSPEVFETVLHLALELSCEGREGKPVGSILVIGDHEKVLQYSRQLVINPFQGYSDEERSIFNPQMEKTVKEFSTIDGAFIIRSDGVVLCAGRHLNAAYEGEDLPHGLGSRHMAAAAITNVTDAAAIAISESTGTVTVFKGGKIFTEIERP
ncbi:MAG TPA: diadenylate cyclase [bacterium]|nr:diadenylate cyclase [bacterium]